MQDSSQSIPQHSGHAASLPARVAGSHSQSTSGSGSGPFLDCSARGWMQGGTGKGESTGQREIKRQTEENKRKIKKTQTKQE